MAKKSKRWTKEDLEAKYPSWIDKIALVDDSLKGLRTGKGRYGNVQKITEDGIRFDSKREYLRYVDLKLIQRAGEIDTLRVHPKFPITIGGVPIMVSSNQHNKWDRHLTYEADFQYWDCDKKIMVIEDVKMQSGHRTGVYKIKRALMRAMGHIITEY